MPARSCANGFLTVGCGLKRENDYLLDLMLFSFGSAIYQLDIAIDTNTRLLGYGLHRKGIQSCHYEVIFLTFGFTLVVFMKS